MSRIEEIGEADGWRCWLCDEPVDPARSVNDDRGPSIDSRTTEKRAKARAKSKKTPQPERLAHRACNTGKGNVIAVVDWPDDLFIADPVPIIPTVERLMAKGGREIVGRCPSQSDADEVAEWFTDRISRLEPTLRISTAVEAGGGQFMVVARAN